MATQGFDEVSGLDHRGGASRIGQGNSDQGHEMKWRCPEQFAQRPRTAALLAQYFVLVDAGDSGLLDRAEAGSGQSRA
jgi:hypothetical protein